MKFEVVKVYGSSRAGVLSTPHGEVETPVFLPVGSVASVKTLTPDELRGAGVQMVLGNTYHLYHQPGVEALKTCGGLARFMGWNGPTLTDSGGFQVFSLSATRKLDETGVTFKSVYDGHNVFLTPEKAFDLQHSIGADLIYALDECPPYPAPRDFVERATALTYRWAKRFLDRSNEVYEFGMNHQGRFLVVQGGIYDDLRKRSVDELASLNPDGFGIGGVSVGEPVEDMYRAAAICCELLPDSYPRHLMGVGTPKDLLECIAVGVDMFDCVVPTRNGRNGQGFTSRGIVNIRLAEYKLDQEALDANCECHTCRNYSRAYLHHLFHAGELLGLRLLSLHNITYYEKLLSDARRSIIEGRFDEWRRLVVSDWAN